MVEIDAEVVTQLLGNVVSRHHAAQTVGNAAVVHLAIKHTDYLLCRVPSPRCRRRVIWSQFLRLAPPLAALLEQVLEHVLKFFACTMQ